MINKFFLAIIISVTLTHCGFSPIYTTGNSKLVVISKSEIIGDKDLAFNLEQRLNFKKDEKDFNAYIFKAQIYDTTESSLVDTRGISTEEIIKLTVSYQFQDKNGVVIYQDAITKDKRVSVTDNLSNNVLIKNNEKRILLDSIIQNILFKSRISLR
jgi:3-deoxy-D-manno-octulosonic acid (KDO) 8-phosphate synthase